MGLINVLGSIVSVFGKVIGVAGSVFKVARPLLEALRPAIGEVEVAMSWLEENAVKVGKGGDDFLDRNLQTILDLEMVSARGQVVFGKLNEIAVALRVASQEVTPDTIDEAEAARLIALFGEFKDILAAWGPELDTALASMKVAEEDMERIGG